MTEEKLVKSGLREFGGSAGGGTAREGSVARDGPWEGQSCVPTWAGYMGRDERPGWEGSVGAFEGRRGGSHPKRRNESSPYIPQED